MKLVLEDGKTSQVSYRDEIIRALATVGVSDNNYAILSQDKEIYIQTTGTVSKGFLIEYREGSEEEHYYSERKDISHEEMVNLILAYYDKRSDWKDAIKWETNNVASVKKEPRKLVTRRNAVILFIVSALFYVTSQIQWKQIKDLNQHLGKATGKILKLK